MFSHEGNLLFWWNLKWRKNYKYLVWFSRKQVVTIYDDCQHFFFCFEEAPSPWQHLWRKPFNWNLLIVQSFSSLLQWQRPWWQEERHGTGEAESSTSWFTDMRKRESSWGWLGLPKSQTSHSETLPEMRPHLRKSLK